MLPRFLLDTHIVIWWLSDSRRLSREQLQTIRKAVRRNEPVALSAISLLEIAVLATKGKLKMALNEFLARLEAGPEFRLLPITYEIALDLASLTALPDPADRAIVATARVHRLTLVTSDQRIRESNLVPVID